jgi:hypothetical protein
MYSTSINNNKGSSTQMISTLVLLFSGAIFGFFIVEMTRWSILHQSAHGSSSSSSRKENSIIINSTLYALMEMKNLEEDPIQEETTTLSNDIKVLCLVPILIYMRKFL